MTVDNTPSGGSDARDLTRSSMFLGAVLRAGSEQAPVRIRNMSPHGAMVETPISPPRGTEVHLIRGRLVAPGTVVWVSSNCCGLRFSSELSIDEWLAVPAKSEQGRVDQVIARVKARATSAPAAVARHFRATGTSTSGEQLAIDLGAVVGLLRDLEDDLASSGETLVRHGIKLQNIDIAMQMIRAIAHELHHGRGDPPISLASLEDLRVACAEVLGRR